MGREGEEQNWSGSPVPLGAQAGVCGCTCVHCICVSRAERKEEKKCAGGDTPPKSTGRNRRRIGPDSLRAVQLLLWGLGCPCSDLAWVRPKEPRPSRATLFLRSCTRCLASPRAPAQRISHCTAAPAPQPLRISH